MTHAEMLRDNALKIATPCCDGLMDVVRVDYISEIGVFGIENPRAIIVKQCRRCGDLVEVAGQEIVGAESSGTWFRLGSGPVLAPPLHAWEAEVRFDRV